ncbi:MAG: dihydroneopterin aldolase [Candidatus Kapabacteria bacterium]|nr:dihydroneopterin aldolase [Candidatus Kapabacteria bacterium]
MKETSLTRLTIKDAVFYAYHGVKSEEQVLGGKYEVDLDLYYNATEAIINDDVNYAVNYEEAMVCIEDVITEESYNLIETITNEILNQVMEKMPNIEKATVRVRKMNVPIRNVVSYIEAEQSITRK